MIDGRTRHALASATTRRGTGLHSGAACAVRMVPAPPGHGRVFHVAGVAIPAHAAHVIDTRACTTLGRGARRVRVVEHLLAALEAHGVEDVALEVEGDEVPALDGSASGWCVALRDAGLVPSGPRNVRTLRAPVRVAQGDSWATAEPADRLHLTVSVDFPHPAIGRGAWSGDTWGPLLDARTFGFLADRDALRAAGLARGVTPDNAVVFDDTGPMHGALRGDDEPVRHKALDLLGDLALLGAPLQARVRVHKGGHTLHRALLDAVEDLA
ncbi:MAG: hypothetical protein RLZZ299_1320 [Pseudomonadota bacterium]